MKTFKAKSSANRAGKKALESAQEGSKLEVTKNEEGTFSFFIVEPEIEVVKEPCGLAEENKAEMEELEEAAKEEPVAEIVEEVVEEVKKKKEILRVSSIESPCKVVWDIAEEMEGARRKDIIQACVDRGIAFYTARTQYQKYREACREAVAVAPIS